MQRMNHVLIGVLYSKTLLKTCYIQATNNIYVSSNTSDGNEYTTV